jgi:hypothetical protein
MTQTTNPYVVAKSAAVQNAVSPATKAEQIEQAEIVKALALNPSRPDAATLNARSSAISTHVKVAAKEASDGIQRTTDKPVGQ